MFERNTNPRVLFGEHWAIIQDHRVTIPGDERSRTNPGHGYPEFIETFQSYRAFSDYNAFLRELEKCEEGTVGVHVIETYVSRRVPAVAKRT